MREPTWKVAPPAESGLSYGAFTGVQSQDQYWGQGPVQGHCTVLWVRCAGAFAVWWKIWFDVQVVRNSANIPHIYAVLSSIIHSDICLHDTSLRGMR